MKRLPLAMTLVFAMNFPVASAQQPPQTTVQSLRVQVLSTMLAGNSNAGIGEWGFSAIVEVDGQRILFDTGARPDTVLKNARELGVDLSGVKDVVLSHNHSDHTNGLLTLRREFSKANRTALSRAHIGKGIFWNRPSDSGEANVMVKIKPEYEATGGAFIEYTEPKEILPGVWLTGPVPRKYPERNWSTSGRVKTPEGLAEDTLPEDMSLVAVTDKGGRFRLRARGHRQHSGVRSAKSSIRSRLCGARWISSLHLERREAGLDGRQAEGIRAEAFPWRPLHRD